VQLDATIEGRGDTPSRLGYWTHLALLVPSVAGLVVLRRRRVPISPFLGIAVAVTATTALSAGVTRYRLGWDVCAVLLTAVALDAGWRLVRRRHRIGEVSPRGPEPGPGAADPASDEDRQPSPAG
jgi:hypothetical protein